MHGRTGLWDAITVAEKRGWHRQSAWPQVSLRTSVHHLQFADRVELGLVLAKGPSIGCSLTQVPDAIAQPYRQQIELVDAALVAYRRGEVKAAHEGGPAELTA